MFVDDHRVGLEVRMVMEKMLVKVAKIMLHTVQICINNTRSQRKIA